uniref:Cadherin-17 n=1 Tax=Callorhinchus milii TaxID=7868 RepID=V9K9S5_CALMI
MRIPSYQTLSTLLLASVSLVVVTEQQGSLPSGPFMSMHLNVVEETNGIQTLFQFTSIDPAVKSFKTSGDKANRFQVFPNGWLILNGTLDREQQAFILLKVEGLKENAEKLIGPIIISIKVVDVNDHRPEFGEEKEGIVRQHSRPGRPFMYVNATDLDDPLTPNAKLEYSIFRQLPMHNGVWFFQIDSETGEISTTDEGTKQLNPEDEQKYELLIKVKDSAPPFLDGTTAVSIIVKENLWQDPKRVNIVEHSPGPHPRTIVKVQWNNPGAIYELRPKERSNFKLPFAVDSYGNISVTKPLDREERDEYVFLAYALDNQRNALEEPLNIHVTVEDINDNAPVCEPATFEVQENEKLGSSIGNVIATDRDDPTSENSLLKYQIVKQWPTKPQDSLFSIDQYVGNIGRNQGNLQKHEASHYNLTILVSDNGINPEELSTECIVQIIVIDINDQIPVFVKTEYGTIKLPENTPLDKVLIKIQATDKDEPSTGSSEILYKIISGDNRGSFKITTDVRTNEGSVMLAKPLDFETQQSYNLIIIAENPEQLVDGKKYNSTATLNFMVEDVHEPPYFLNSSYQLSIHENSKVGTSLLKVEALDPEGSKLSYSITSDPLSWVKINAQSGEIFINKEMDRETESKYDIKVTATEQGGSFMSSTVDVAIFLLDINDNDPRVSDGFNKLFTCFPVMKEEKMIFKAADFDSQYGFPFTFSIDGSNNDWKLEKINGSHAYIVTKHKRYEQKVYEVPVKIFDNDEPPRSGDALIQINVCKCSTAKTCFVPIEDIGHASIGLALGLLLGSLVLIGSILAVVFIRLNRKKKGELTAKPKKENTREENVPLKQVQ